MYSAETVTFASLAVESQSPISILPHGLANLSFVETTGLTGALLMEQNLSPTKTSA